MNRHGDFREGQEKPSGKVEKRGVIYMPKQVVYCESCGKKMERYPCQISAHNFCSRECTKSFTSKRMTEYNQTKNPMNTSGHSYKSQEEIHAIRVKAALAGRSYKKDTYKKLGGRHEHRVVAESVLGRPLRDGEVVHHIDGNKQNNKPENLMVFSCQSDHAAWHEEHDGFWHKKGDDAL